MGSLALRARTLLVMGLVLVPGVAAAQSTISGAVTDTDRRRVAGCQRRSLESRAD